jgi:tRNA pseudouridine55 synthase
VARRTDGPGPEGVLVIAKPPGPTSHDVVALVRRLSGTRRVGHGGTLDPFASGVLPLFLGRATRLVEYHAADRKQYRATICFGARSTTDDLDGELSPVDGPPLRRDAVEAGLAGMTGAIEQVPPAHSAVRVGGRRAYALARAGEVPQLAPRTVSIERLELVEWDDRDPSRPIAVVEVDCSPGTYVRAIARDLGAVLGSGAYLCALVRTASGPFRLGDAVSLEDLRSEVGRDPEAMQRWLRPIDAGLDALPRVSLAADEVSDVTMGRFVRPAAGLPGGPPETPLRLIDPQGRLVGIGLRRGARLLPTKVLVETGRGSDGLDRGQAPAGGPR